MNATGWCENCGDVEVEVLCYNSIYGGQYPPRVGDPAYPSCCHYADCRQCGEDVDQWATS